MSTLTQGENGTTAINIDDTVTYTPETGFYGLDSFTYTANDGTTDSNVATVTVTVNPGIVNNPPVAVPDTTTTDPDTPVIVAVLANDTDAEGEPLTISDFTQGSHGTVDIFLDDTMIYTPDSGFRLCRDDFVR